MYFAIVGTMAMEAIVKAQADRITQNRRTMKVSELTGALPELEVAYSDFWAGWLVCVNEGPHSYPVSQARGTKEEAEALAKQWSAELQAGKKPAYELPSPDEFAAAFDGTLQFERMQQIDNRKIADRLAEMGGTPPDIPASK